MVLQLAPNYMGNTETGPLRNSMTWRSHYMPSPYNRATDPTWTGLIFNDFDHFHYDEGTFGDYIPKLPGAYRGYTSVSHPQLLPDSPTCRIRQYGQYHGPRTSRFLAGQGDEKELEEAEQAHKEHASFWRLPNRPKGKEPDQGQSLPVPPYPDLIPQPIGHYTNNAPHLGIKLILLQPLKPFKGDHDDIEYFLGDCTTYFEVFVLFFQLSLQTIPFAASYFEGTVKDWWVYKQQEFWADSDWDPTPPRY
ncbi:uncharacterized protein ARMOST_06965 [Armillaria ostoyae]|uniref:Uncharacterized protein n=1 Tax=Armillaria ostoyae TaxID=47428 RepID=A0A284R4I3_ARMOS|nr:uncharacterized protein ARMOST_06965 [Armillaria ostoyae]